MQENQLTVVTLADWCMFRRLWKDSVMLSWGRNLRSYLCPRLSGLLLKQQLPFLQTPSERHLPFSHSRRKSTPQPPPLLAETSRPNPEPSGQQIPGTRSSGRKASGRGGRGRAAAGGHRATWEVPCGDVLCQTQTEPGGCVWFKFPAATQSKRKLRSTLSWLISMCCVIYLLKKYSYVEGPEEGLRLQL